MRNRQQPKSSAESTPRVRTLRKALDLVGPGQWKRWLLLVVLALIVSGFEMLGAAMVFVLIGLVSNPRGPIELPLVGNVRRLASDVDQEVLLLWLVGLLAAFFLVRAGVRATSIYVQARVAHNAGARLSNRLVAGYLRSPYPFHLRRSSSELIRNSHQASQQLVGQVFLPVIRIGAESVMVIGLLVIMVVVAPVATATAVLVIVGAAAVVLLLVQPRLKRLGRTSHVANRETLELLQQGLHGIRDIKVLGRERWFEGAYRRSRLEMARALYLRTTLSEFPRSVIELSLLGFILAVFAAAIIADEGTSSTLSVVGLFAYVGLRLQPSIQNIVSGLNDLKFSVAPLDDLHADLLEVGDLEAPQVVEPLAFREEIALQGVSFRYEGTHVDAITDVDVTICRGEQVGICGPTGGGKTTLVDVITGLLEPTSGKVSVDGVDIRHHTRAWQRNLGIVPQTLFLLDDTLRANIALGIPQGDFDEDAVEEAIDLAQLRDFVDSLPDGLDTRVGERGIRISGGQRQRIAIARALYHRPRVLIFDEGTSALDNTTEAALMDAIDRLRSDHTVILVAHRLSTVRRSDQVLFLEQGRITGRGTYDELVASHASFRVMTGAS